MARTLYPVATRSAAGGEASLWNDPRMAATWHSLPVGAVLAELQTEAGGLTSAEVERRRARHGENRLRPPPPTPALKVLVAQLTSVVVLLLVAAAVVSLVLGDRLEAAAVGAVLVINALLGFVTELRARRAMEALLQYQAPRASVVREGRLHVIGAEALVPGDVVQLAPGQAVPADGRLIEGHDLRTVEAALTGESLPVSKTTAPVPPDAPLAERACMVYQGTTVAAGTAGVVITETGERTELGRIGTLVGSLREEPTPLERRLDALGRRLVWLALGVALLVAVLGAARGAPLGLMVEMGIALAVAAVPEALPAVATIALAVGLRRMARRRALVRRLPAVEALGSTTVICTDKTRTLTSGEMTVVRAWASETEADLTTENEAAAAPAVRALLEIAALASEPQPHAADGQRPAGDPVDLALLRVAERAGLDRAALLRRQPRLAVVPFSSERKLMCSFHDRDGSVVAQVKGAPRRVLDLCARRRTAEGERPLDEQGRQEMLDVNGRLARRGLRVLALAAGPVGAADEASLRDLTFAGFVGLMDPPAPGVKDTIARLRGAGLRTVMLTGDQRLTAEAVGRELGVLSSADEVVDERELSALSEAGLRAKVAAAGAFSRVTPEHKLALVRALQDDGQIVAMLGDGVNDAAALRKADVGVAMGLRGTDVAKEAAAIVLQDDRFETIAAAVEEGRVVYDNIRKVVFYLFSCNVAEVLVLLGAGLLGLPLPLLPLQVLWLNIVTDTFPALALALEPADPDVMRRPPRDPREAILSRTFLSAVLGYGLLITLSTLLAFAWTLGRAPEQAVTAAFMTLALAQLFHLGNARSREAVLDWRHAVANGWALAALGLTVALQLTAVFFAPLAHVLRVSPLHGAAWAVVLACSLAPGVAGQALKWLAGRRLVTA
jgi:Ca2+-transporting ATPase